MSACGRHPAKAPRRTREKTSGTQGIQRSILGDPGQIVGARKSLNGRKNKARKKGKNGEKRPLGTMSYQTSSKRSPPFWLLIGARIGAPTICPTISEDANRLNSLNNGAMGGDGVGGRLYTGNYTALFVYNLVIGYSKRREKIIRLKAFDKKKKIPGLKSNQVLGTVLQCSYFSVISRFPLKTVQRYQNFLAGLPPHSIRS